MRKLAATQRLRMSQSPFSNLQNFLNSVTFPVPSKSLPKESLNDINKFWIFDGTDSIQYFTLRDLWGAFEEWSAYGIVTPVKLKERTVEQYFAPCLSAIQLYISKTNAIFRHQKEGTSAPDFKIDQCLSTDEEIYHLSRWMSNNSSKISDATTSSESNYNDQGSCSIKDRLGYLYLQYQDISSPYLRLPLAEKIDELVQRYPGLLSLNSVDLSPASWMSISWFPIYHIPHKLDGKDVPAYFLTYHTLSSYFQDDFDNSPQSQKKFKNQVTLPPFGLASFKMHREVWVNPAKEDHERLMDLHSAADSWLKQFNFQHYDFNFYYKHSNPRMG